jgi:predicted Zn-dependent protease
VFGDASGVVGVIAENADMLKRLSYSRDFEHEADANAYTLMVDQLIETEGLVSLFKQLQIEEQKQGIDIPQFISSHPLTDDRIDFIQQKIKNDNIRFVSNEKLKKIFEELKSMETTPSKEENEVELIEKKVRELVDSLGLE